uniref:Uncharacterized protein n=1 Tax=Arundo donax TaxID=35708 RepID=A0A0A9HP64_ARUDO
MTVNAASFQTVEPTNLVHNSFLLLTSTVLLFSKTEHLVNLVYLHTRYKNPYWIGKKNID